MSSVPMSAGGGTADATKHHTNEVKAMSHGGGGGSRQAWRWLGWRRTRRSRPKSRRPRPGGGWGGQPTRRLGITTRSQLGRSKL